MLVTPFILEIHSMQLSVLLRDRHMNPSLIEDLPKFGLIALNKTGIPIAAGFLREIEGRKAMLDSYISNPHESSETRDRALDLITYKLLKIAKENSIKQVIAFSADLNTIARAERHGLMSLPHNVFQIIQLD